MAGKCATVSWAYIETGLRWGMKKQERGSVGNARGQLVPGEDVDGDPDAGMNNPRGSDRHGFGAE